MNNLTLLNNSTRNHSVFENQTKINEIPAADDFDSLVYIFAPLGVLVTVFVLAILVFMMATRKRPRPIDREALIPVYDCYNDPYDETEEFTWLLSEQSTSTGIGVKPNYQRNNNTFELVA